MSMLLAVKVWQLNLDKTTSLILMAMCDSADDDGTHCHASEDYLMWKTNVSRATLYRVMNALTAQKIIARQTYLDGSVETIISLENAPQKAPWKRPRRGGKRTKQDNGRLTARPFESHHETHSVSQRDPLSLTARPFESHHETDANRTEPEPVSDGEAKNVPIHPITHPSNPTYQPSSLAPQAPISTPHEEWAPQAQERGLSHQADYEALKRDPLYGAFARALNYEPQTRPAWEEWRLGINELNRLQATPLDVHRTITAFYDRFPQATCTVRATIKWWAALKEGKRHDIAKLEVSQRVSEIRRAEERQRLEQQQRDADRLRAELERDIANGAL